MRPKMHLALRAGVAAVAVALTVETGAYAPTGVTWAQSPVPYSINTTNLDLPESAVEPAMRATGNAALARRAAGPG